MGNDGGSIPDRRDLVRTKAKAEQADKANQTKARWFFCALSKRKLQEPIVSCALGKLYNKDAIIEYLLNKQAYGDGEKICGHIRSLKDVKTLKLTPNPAASSPDSHSHSHSIPHSNSQNEDAAAPFVCALTLKEMNGVQPFVYLSTCGCVFSQAGLRTVAQSVVQSVVQSTVKDKGKAKDSEKVPSPEETGTEDPASLYLCPQCQTKYNPADDVVPLNPSEEEELKMRFRMERRRAVEAAEKKEKRGKKRKGGAEGAKDEEGKGKEEPPTKKPHTSSSTPTPRTSTPQPHPHPHPSHPSSLPTSLLADLAREEAKRKASMTPALQSLYGDRDGNGKDGKRWGRKETFMTMGTFTRYA